MKKKIVGVLMAAAMVAALVSGCGNSSQSSSQTSSAASSTSSKSGSEEASSVSSASSASTSSDIASMDECTDTYMKEHYQDFCGADPVEGKKVGLTVQSLGNDFMVYLTGGIQEAFEELGVDIQIDSCDGDSNKQVEQIENYMTMGKDLIIAFPLNGESLVTVMNQAEDAGIPTIAFAMDIPSDKLTSHLISANEDTLGAACGTMSNDWINANLADKDEVKVLLIGSTTSPEMGVRSDNIESTLKSNSKVVLTRQDSPDSNSTDEGRNTAENMFLGETYDVVVCANATTALGVDSYIMSSDSPIEDLSKFAVFAVDETDEIDAKILSSVDNESVIRGTISMGGIGDTVAALISTAMPILTKGNPVERVNGDAFTITAETLAE